MLGAILVGRRRVLGAALVLSWLALVVACQGPVAEPVAVDVVVTPESTGEAMVEGQSLIVEHVDFETIERVERTTGNRAEAQWESTGSGVMVIGRVEEVEALGKLISAEAKAQLLALDYGERFAVVVFLGRQPHVEEFIVEGVLKWEDHLSLQATVPITHESLPAESSPYHIISLRREWVLQEPLRFDLWIGGRHAVVGLYPPVLSEATPMPSPTSPYTPAPTYTPWPTGTASPTASPTPEGMPGPTGTPWPGEYPPPWATPLVDSTVTPYPAPGRVVD